MKLEDALPNTLCKICEEKLKSFYEFRILCQKSDTALRELTQTENKSTNKGDISNQQDLSEPIFDEDDLPLIIRSVSTSPSISKRKRGRPKKSDAHPYNCTYCNKVLHTAKGFKTHLRVHTGDKVKQCLFCDAKYTRTNHLMRHIISHDKPGLKHPCEHCDKTFKAAADLFKHSRTHDQLEFDEEVQIKKEEVSEDQTLNLIEDLEVMEDIKTSIDEEDPEMGRELSLEQDEVVDDPAGNDFTGFDDPFDEIDDNNDFEMDDDDDEIETKKLKKKDEDSFDCKVCQKVLTTNKGLKAHMRSHMGISSLHCKVSI